MNVFRHCLAVGFSPTTHSSSRQWVSSHHSASPSSRWEVSDQPQTPIFCQWGASVVPSFNMPSILGTKTDKQAPPAKSLFVAENRWVNICGQANRYCSGIPIKIPQYSLSWAGGGIAAPNRFFESDTSFPVILAPTTFWITRLWLFSSGKKLSIDSHCEKGKLYENILTPGRLVSSGGLLSLTFGPIGDSSAVSSEVNVSHDLIIA